MKNGFSIPHRMVFRHLCGRYPVLAVSSFLLYEAGRLAHHAAVFVRTELCMREASRAACGEMLWAVTEAVLFLFLFCPVLFGAVSFAGQVKEEKSGAHPGWILDGFSSGACYARSIEAGLLFFVRLLLYVGMARGMAEVVDYFAADRTAGFLLFLDLCLIISFAAGFFQKFMPVIWIFTEVPDCTLRDALRIARRMTDGRKSEILFYRIFPLTFSVIAYVRSPALFCMVFPVLLATDAVIFRSLKDCLQTETGLKCREAAMLCGMHVSEKTGPL